jgi:ribosomal protein S18 acetylase RimI-like enzyme
VNTVVEYRLNTASEAEILDHLRVCDADFIHPLSSRVEISEYAQKIASKATKFEAWSGNSLVGLVAVYCNNQENLIAYITSVSVMKEWLGNRIAARLMSQCVDHVRASSMQQISLEVASDNTPAIKLYEKNGFVAGKPSGSFVCMNLYLKSEE